MRKVVIYRLYGGCSWALELTEFTVSEVRADLARARAAGRALRDALLEDPARFEHLKGRRVAASVRHC